MKSKIILLVVLIVALAAALRVGSMIQSSLSSAPSPVTGGQVGNGSGIGVDEPGNVFCTMDAKICPDGSAVGRVPPSCEFAACPDPSSGSSDAGGAAGGTMPAGSDIESEATITARMNHPASGADVTITPLEVVEDSRCPADVVCIQAGTVRLSTRLSTATGATAQVFTLNQPVTTATEVITLTAVQPYPYSSRTIAPADYSFTFTVKKRLEVM